METHGNKKQQTKQKWRSVSEAIHMVVFRMETYTQVKMLLYLCPSIVHRDTPQRSGLNLASWGM